MAILTDIVNLLNETLQPQRFEDTALNGLQVDAGTHHVTTVGLAVDSGLSVIQEAIKLKCELLIIHHGLFWGKETPLTESYGEKVRLLMRHGCSVYGAHLPLDAHMTLGNNIALADFFELEGATGAFPHHGSLIGVVAHSSAPRKRSYFVDQSKNMKGALASPLMLPFGKEEITSVGIVSGGAALDIVEAKKIGVDLFITGEPKQSVYHLAQELQINALFAGHYATETFGVQRLGALLQKQFGVAPRFIDIPTGI